MPGYATVTRTLRLGGEDFRIRSLSDRQQFADPDRQSERLGISSAQWSLFGQIWPAGRLLANAMSQHTVGSQRILELGCGIGLASLLLQSRGANITASDVHPLAEVFLAYNAALNDLPAVRYRALRWNEPDGALGRFDLIIGSDILYEREQATVLAAVVARHAQPWAEILITDPGRGNSAQFTRLMEAQGYGVSVQRSPMDASDLPPFRGQLLSYRRTELHASAPGIQ
ncbi:MAG: SAM-dependent methyltransferase [Rhodanobacter sp.]